MSDDNANNTQSGHPHKSGEGWMLVKVFEHYGVVIVIVVIVVLAALLLPVLGAIKERPHIVVYTSQDQVYSQQILAEFTRDTGIEVRPVYDSEAVKTVGLANRLLAERENPQCDVWWSNEELRTRQLAGERVFDTSVPWKAFGFRSRKLVVNTNLVSLADAPRSLKELTDEQWRGRVAMAYPMFGTTSVHMLALRQLWGVAEWRDWCRKIQSNEAMIVDGNSVVVRLVGAGEAAIGLTDYDDIEAGRKNGLPVAAVEIEETLFVPNTVALVRGARNGGAARKLMDYLGSPEVVMRLVEANALEGDIAAVAKPGFPDWDGVLRDLEAGTKELGEVFLR
jgi:iron(III) transport system substrate-binding protein